MISRTPERFFLSVLTVVVILCGTLTTGCAMTSKCCSSSIAEFKEFPENKSPEDVGWLVSVNMIPRWIITRAGVHYAEDTTWVHGLQFADLTGDVKLKETLTRRFDRFLEPGGKDLISNHRHVDHTIFGIIPLELYIQTGDERYLEIGKALADRQWENPDDKGLSEETRFWIDDMYMITMLQVQAYRATKDPVYLDRAALEMVAYLDELQRPNGLFYHGVGAPFFWGRGNGWVAAGMTELLRFLPEDHKHYDRIMKGYRNMMAALLDFQAENGMWHQLIDGPDSYQESSCTAMFSYAMLTGVNRGWLPKDPYAAAARKGWLALTDHIDTAGNVDKVCIGTGKSDNRQHYLDRPTRNGDPHGQAPALWCAVGLLRGE